jgi:hypothetical protein
MLISFKQDTVKSVRTPLIVQLSGFAENRTQKIIYNIKSKTIVKLVLIETLWDQILCLK